MLTCTKNDGVLPRTVDHIVYDLLHSVHICDRTSFIITTVTKLLNCTLTEIYFMFYTLFVYIKSFFKIDRLHKILF